MQVVTVNHALPASTDQDDESVADTRTSSRTTDENAIGQWDRVELRRGPNRSRKKVFLKNPSGQDARRNRCPAVTVLDEARENLPTDSSCGEGATFRSAQSIEARNQLVGVPVGIPKQAKRSGQRVEKAPASGRRADVLAAERVGAAEDEEAGHAGREPTVDEVALRREALGAHEAGRLPRVLPARAVQLVDLLHAVLGLAGAGTRLAVDDGVNVAGRKERQPTTIDTGANGRAAHKTAMNARANRRGRPAASSSDMGRAVNPDSCGDSTHSTTRPQRQAASAFVEQESKWANEQQGTGPPGPGQRAVQEKGGYQRSQSLPDLPRDNSDAFFAPWRGMAVLCGVPPLHTPDADQ